MTSASDEKWRLFNCFFQSREQVVVRRGQIRRIGWGIKKMEAQVGQFLVGCMCPVSWGIVVRKQDPFGDLPAAFYFQTINYNKLSDMRLSDLQLFPYQPQLYPITCVLYNYLVVTTES